MAGRSRQSAARKDVTKNEQLKGTFVSVLLVGGFILASWLVIVALYLYRQ